MKGKGKQFVPEGTKVVMAFPGGAGYGDPGERPQADIVRDLALGYISAQTARECYGLDQSVIDDVLDRAALGDVF